MGAQVQCNGSVFLPHTNNFGGNNDFGFEPRYPT